ncbi:MAG TPA: gliding motility-associated C-terminal domain-containing protein, partial [Edaphocola sp.]|nr:gliding motility-associated C-terminal domain-containing protein [Edaphocola sp.]
SLLTFKVYNRLGQLVFNTKNKVNGWDGTLNGKPAPADTYFYMIEVVLPDGTHQKFKGDVTLVR